MKLLLLLMFLSATYSLAQNADSTIQTDKVSQPIEVTDMLGGQTIFISASGGYAMMALDEVNSDLADNQESLISVVQSSNLTEVKGGPYFDGSLLFRAGQVLIGGMACKVSGTGEITHIDIAATVSEKYSVKTTEFLGVAGGIFPVWESAAIIVKVGGGYGLASCTHDYLLTQNNFGIIFKEHNEVSDGYFAGRLDLGLQFRLNQFGLNVFGGYRYSQPGEMRGTRSVNQYTFDYTYTYPNQPIRNGDGEGIEFDFSGLLGAVGLTFGF